MRPIDCRHNRSNGVRPPGGGAWGDNLPANFSWLAVNKIAGCACPQSELELRSLAGLGINHLITLSPDAMPPNCITNIPNLKWTIIPVENFHGASNDDFKTFFNICDDNLCEKGDAGAVLVHCKSGRGRTGMFLAAYLMQYNNMSASAGMAAVRAARPGSIETKSQEKSLMELEDFLQKQKKEDY